MKPGFFVRLLIGNPLATESLRHQRLTKTKGLAVFSSDALSSSAYATEEIIHVLILAGTVGLAATLPVSLAILTLLVIVGISYYQTIHAYPSGGGAYIVARENLGEIPGLIAGSALLVDYVLTVAVSVSAGVSAMTSAVPGLFPWRVEIALACMALMTIANLRGVKESGTFFAIPAYLFILVFGGMLVFGLMKLLAGRLEPVSYPSEVMEAHGVSTLGVFLICRAFASGAAALTGIEAVSNGVPAFFAPESRNASRVLIWMIAILGSFFIGVSILASYMHVLPLGHETVISQVARQVFGTSPAYYAVQTVTAMILILAANTAYADFPRLASILAKDSYLPRQLASLGDRLVFANGILLLGAVCSVLLISFSADTHSLIPLYMIGVFISFTLSQSGMVIHWLRAKSGRWKTQAAINGFGALCTCVVGFVVAIVKFSEGAWITLLIITIFIFFMAAVRRHYDFLSVQLSLERARIPRPFDSHQVLVPVSGVHRGTLESLRYAKAISKEVSGVYVELDPARTPIFRQQWEKWADNVPLTILSSPYRSVIGPLLLHFERIQHDAGPNGAVTILIPQFIPRRWWHHVLHNQTSWLLKLALLFRQRNLRRCKIISDVPFYLRR